MSSTSAFPALTELRAIVFATVDTWNAAHPVALHSRRERASVNVTESYTGESQPPNYTIVIDLKLASYTLLTFRGNDLNTLAEQARETLERKIANETRRREERVAS